MNNRTGQVDGVADSLGRMYSHYLLPEHGTFPAHQMAARSDHLKSRRWSMNTREDKAADLAMSDAKSKDTHRRVNDLHYLLSVVAVLMMMKTIREHLTGFADVLDHRCNFADTQVQRDVS